MLAAATDPPSLLMTDLGGGGRVADALLGADACPDKNNAATPAGLALLDYQGAEYPDSWTVREDSAGRWVADWCEPEPANAPPPSIGWLTWHILWWSDALAVVRGGAPGRRVDVYWPGTAPGVIAELGKLAAGLDSATVGLDREALQRPAAFPWPDERPLIYTIAWVPLELMKNVAETGAQANSYVNRANSVKT